MGVKSTVELTRAEAVERYVQLYLEKRRAAALADAASFSNRELAERPQNLNDDRAGGEGFENYYITDGGDG